MVYVHWSLAKLEEVSRYKKVPRYFNESLVVKNIYGLGEEGSKVSRQRHFLAVIE